MRHVRVQERTEALNPEMAIIMTCPDMTEQKGR